MDNKEVTEFEGKFKSILFDKIGEIASKQAELISQIQKTGKQVGLESDLPNLAITLNNKLVELKHEFQNAGLSIYSRKYEYEDYEFVGTSFIGEAIIEDLINYLDKGTQNLFDYDKTMSEITKEKVEQKQALEKVSPFRRLFARIKNLFVPVKQDDMSYTEEEKGKINTHLSDYKDIDNKLWNYNLKDNIILSIVRKIRERGYGAYTVAELLEESVIPDLQKLGLADLIPELQEAIIEEYKKDLPDSEIYQISEEDMHLYVPDFSRKSEENKRFAETGLEGIHSQAQAVVSEGKRNLRRNGIVIDDLTLIDKDITASDRQVVTKAIQAELQPVKENKQDKTQEPTDITLE